MSGWRSRAAIGLTAGCLLAALAGCNASTERRAAAADAATGLLKAVAAGDGAAACGLLAPDTADKVAEAAGQPCPAAILQQGLPGPAEVRATDVYGRQARVVLADDTVFLAAFRGGWRVVAAGCQPRPGEPYDCAVEGA